MPISTNEVGLLPVSPIELIVRAEPPVFVSITPCALVVEPTAMDGKAIEAVDNNTTGPPAVVPVPLRDAVCGDPVALSATERDAERGPDLDGANSTETVQEAAAASEAPQVVPDFTNDVPLVPVMVSEVRVTVLEPVFFTVINWAALVMPTWVAANVRLVGVNVMEPEEAAFTFTVSSPKSLQRDGHAVRLNTALVMLGPV